MGSVSGYYTNSPETVVEADLADLRNVNTDAEFTALLENKIAAVFTNDFFEVTLPNNLATSASRSPVWFGYCAALNILGAKVLFSTLTTRELFSPASTGTRNALERHHLFPKAFLKKINITDDRDRNQNANFAFIEWQDNIEILDASPAEYMEDRLAKIPEADKPTVYEMHALPDGWQHMDYFEFLHQRRKLMSHVIRKGFEKL